MPGLTENRRRKAYRIAAALGDRVSLDALRAASPATRRRLAQAAGYDDVSGATWELVLETCALSQGHNGQRATERQIREVMQ